MNAVFLLALAATPAGHDLEGVRADPLVGRLARLAAELDLSVHAADPLDMCTDAGNGMEGVPLASVLAAALAELGLPNVPPCPVVDGDEAAKDRAARDAGAEWRLVVRPDDEGLALELHAVDRGLWGPRDLGPVIAFAKETQEVAPKPTDPVTPRPEPGVSVARAFVTERTVRAMGACDLNNDGTRELIAVTDDRVVVWREIRGVLAPGAELVFADLPRASARVRAPVAGCVCGPFGPGGATRLAVGHSDHERGLVLFARAEGTTLKLERERTLPAIPLGQSGSDILGALPDQGRNRLGPALVSMRLGDDKTSDLERTILEIASLAGGLKTFALDSEYRVLALTDARALGGQVATSGAGIALMTGPDGALLLAVTSRTPGSNDSVRLIDASTGATRAGPIAVAGAIVASTGGRAGELYLATRPPDAARTVILRLTLGDTRR